MKIQFLFHDKIATKHTLYTIKDETRQKGSRPTHAAHRESDATTNPENIR